MVEAGWVIQYPSTSKGVESLYSSPCAKVLRLDSADLLPGSIHKARVTRRGTPVYVSSS